MNLNDSAPLACISLPASQRCAATLPDNPECGLNYHFGMLLGVDDFQAEQGFHVGRLRRHQRLLHGWGVVAGFPLAFDAISFDLSVGPGYAIDILGRDLWLAIRQCVNLALWWQKHAGDDAFHGLDPNDATLDLDLQVCYATCLDRPVPAIAEPCAGDAADIAHARLCETVSLQLIKHVDPPPVAAGDQPYHLWRLWLGLDEIATLADGTLAPDDQWLADQQAALAALPADHQDAALAALRQQVLARAVTATSPLRPEVVPDPSGEASTCITIARLTPLHIWHDGAGWHVTLGNAATLNGWPRPLLLPTELLQAELLADPDAAGPPPGPLLLPGGIALAGSSLKLSFNQALAAASVTAQAFAVSEFDPASGWHPFTLAAPSIDASLPGRPVVTLGLDRLPSGKLLRATVIGSGPAPLLGSQWIAAGALSATGDGRDLSSSLTL